MNLKNAVRTAYLDALITRYGVEWVATHLPHDTAQLDEAIGLDGLIDRIDCEINLAAEEMEYNIIDEEDE